MKKCLWMMIAALMLGCVGCGDAASNGPSDNRDASVADAGDAGADTMPDATPDAQPDTFDGTSRQEAEAAAERLNSETADPGDGETAPSCDGLGDTIAHTCNYEPNEGHDYECLWKVYEVSADDWRARCTCAYTVAEKLAAVPDC